MRISAKETLLFEGGVSRSDNGARWFGYRGVGICVRGTLCSLEGLGFCPEEPALLRFLTYDCFFSAMVMLEVWTDENAI